MVTKLSCPRIGRNLFISGRCDGASSTSAVSSGISVESVCIRKSTGIGSAAFGAGGNVRPLKTSRLVSGNSADSMVRAGFMVAMMLVPDGVTAAAVGSSVIWKIGVAPSKIGAWPSTWNVNTGAPITTTRSCSRNASDSCPGEACKKPANCGCRSGKLQRDENGLTHTAALAFSATCTIRSTACARSTAGPTTRAGRLLLLSAAASARIASGSGPSSRLILRAGIGWVGWVQSSIGTETKVGPHGGCIAT